MGLEEPGQVGPSYALDVFSNGTLAQVSGVCEGSCSERSDITQSFPILPQIKDTDLRVPRGLPVWGSSCAECHGTVRMMGSPSTAVFPLNPTASL